MTAMSLLLPLPRTLARGSNNNVLKYQRDTNNSVAKPKTILISKRNDENTLITTLFFFVFVYRLLIFVFVIPFLFCSAVAVVSGFN